MTFDICVQIVCDDEQRDDVVVGGARAARAQPGARPARPASAGPRPAHACLRRTVWGEMDSSLLGRFLAVI